MKFYLLAALVAAAAAAPIVDLLPRQATCSALKPTTTTVGGKTYTLTGPFVIQAKVAPTSKASKVNGKDAHANANTYDNVVFGVAQQAAAQQFYLDSTHHLVSFEGNTLYTAYSYNYDGAVGPVPHVAIGPIQHSPSTPVTCRINKSTCALSCTQGGFRENCLSSPGYQPDWSIQKVSPKCIQFTPIVIPV